jgi:hypothetical protein
MFTIPADLDRWHPNDINAWARGLDDDPEVTPDDYQRAQRAVAEALLGDAVQL